MTHKDQINEAIASHGLWKFRLKKAIEAGESDWTVPELRRDDACEFGAWLGSLPPAEQGSDHCRTVRDLHAQIHAEAANVLQLAIDGRKEDAEAAIRFGSPFAVLSAKLTSAMTAWRDV